MSTSIKAAMTAAFLMTFFSMVPAVPALAANDIYKLDIAEAMSSPVVSEKLSGDVTFYFGESAHPAILEALGDDVTNQKTNAFGKADEKACTWVFASALLRLEKRARVLGANAVVNIRSYYKKNEVSSETHIDCHVGFVMAGISLKGDFVKIAE